MLMMMMMLLIKDEEDEDDVVVCIHSIVVFTTKDSTYRRLILNRVVESISHALLQQEKKSRYMTAQATILLRLVSVIIPTDEDHSSSPHDHRSLAYLPIYRSID